MAAGPVLAAVVSEVSEGAVPVSPAEVPEAVVSVAEAVVSVAGAVEVSDESADETGADDCRSDGAVVPATAESVGYMASMAFFMMDTRMTTIAMISSRMAAHRRRICRSCRFFCTERALDMEYVTGFFMTLYDSFRRTGSKKSFDNAVGVDINVYGSGSGRKPRHGYDGACQNDEIPCTRG